MTVLIPANKIKPVDFKKRKLIVIRFQGGGEKFIRDLSKKMNREPQDANKFCFALMFKIMERVIGRKETLSIEGDVFTPYANIVISPGDKKRKKSPRGSTAKMFRFPVAK